MLRYCLNLNFRAEYRIHDDIMALLHEAVQLQPNPTSAKRAHSGRPAGAPPHAPPRPPMKSIFITSPVSILYLPHISPLSPRCPAADEEHLHHLACIYPISPPHLPSISQMPGRR